MLQTRRIPQLLEKGLRDGITGIVLLTVDGSILSSVTTSPATSDVLLGALSSSFWSNTVKDQQPDLLMYLLRLEKGGLAVASVGKGYLLGVMGDDSCSFGLLKARTEAIKSHLSRVFEQLV